MKQITSTTALALAALLALMAGCESPSKATAPNTALTETRTPTTSAATGGAGATTAATSQSGVSTVNLGTNAAGVAALAAPTERVVYFDFDSFVIKQDYQNLIDGHAKVLVRNNGKRMTVEGHTDERGGREYNLALGQKRAEAVVKSLALLGVPESRLEAVSFGKERPANPSGGETAWAQNRRAELKDR